MKVKKLPDSETYILKKKTQEKKEREREGERESNKRQRRALHNAKE